LTSYPQSALQPQSQYRSGLDLPGIRPLSSLAFNARAFTKNDLEMQRLCLASVSALIHAVNDGSIGMVAA